MRTPKQFNNITERVIDDLKQVLSSGNSQISIAAASFSIYAYEALKEELEKVDCVNFIFTSPTFYTDATTAHALMKMNSNKNFQCKFILVQLPEEVNDTKKEQEYKIYVKLVKNVSVVLERKLRKNLH